jgi:hypothetical protein
LQDAFVIETPMRPIEVAVTFRASLVALMSVFSFTVGACGGKQEPAAGAGPAAVGGPAHTPAAPKTAARDERQPRREIEPPPTVARPAPPREVAKPDKADKPDEVAKVAKVEAPDKVDKADTVAKVEPPDDVVKLDKIEKVEPSDPAPADPSAPAKGEAMHELTITDAALTPEIADRIPTERKTRWTIGADTKVIAWFEVKNSGDKVPLTLVWKKNGKEAWRFDTEVGKGKNWRTWAEKKIGKKDAGQWTVELVDEGGFAYQTLAYEVVAGASATEP